MPTITAIKLQRRNTSRCNISVDGSYAFALSNLDVSAYGLKVGLELTTETIEELSSSAEVDTVYEAALRLLDVRMRSGQELQQRLARKEYDHEVIAQVLARLQKSGLINDQDFAARWVRDRMNLRPRSRRQLEQELMVKGISREHIAAALADLSPDDQLATLGELIAKKHHQGYDGQKLMSYLARQGYSYSDIKKALERQAEGDLLSGDQSESHYNYNRPE